MADSSPPPPENDVSPTDGDASQSSVARGRETRTALLQKLRSPPLVHSWVFWLEKESTEPAAKASSPDSSFTTPHNTTVTELHTITDVKSFWNLFNNFSFSALPARISVHLFHSTVKPVWEDERNVSGGAWTFRIARNSASPFFRALALLAVGEQLQEAVTDEGKTVFRDDICGISYTVKSDKMVAISVWNRDAGNEAGKQRLLDVVMRTVPPQTRPTEGSYYYKKHADHVGFSAKSAAGKVKVTDAMEKSEEVSKSVKAVEAEFEKVRKILDEVKIKDAEMVAKLSAEIARSESKAEPGSGGTV